MTITLTAEQKRILPLVMYDAATIASRLSFPREFVHSSLQRLRTKLHAKCTSNSKADRMRNATSMALIALGRGLIRADELDTVSPAWYPPHLELMGRALVREMDEHRTESAAYWEVYGWLTP